MPRQPMGRRIEAACGKRAGFDKFLLRVRMHGRVMTYSYKRPVSPRAKTDSLDGRGTNADIVKNLTARQRDLHRPVQATRGDRGQNCLGMNAQLGSEAAA